MAKGEKYTPQQITGAATKILKTRGPAGFKKFLRESKLNEQTPQAVNPRLQKLKAKWEAMCSKRGMKVAGTGAGSFKCVGEEGQRKGLLPGQEDKVDQLPAVKGLQYRAKGAEVKKLQQLISLAGASDVPIGDILAAIKPDGSFGPDTGRKIIRLKYMPKNAGGMGLPWPDPAFEKLWSDGKIKRILAGGLATVDAPTYKTIVALAKRGFQKLFA